MTETVSVKRIFLDPSRCIGCRSCVSACRECDTHKGESMIYIDYLERAQTVATSPTLCMHCEDPLAPCAQVCPAQAILVSPDGVVHQADESRCIYCENCGYACPFGVPKFDVQKHFMRKCNLCYDRTSQGKGPMCTTVCPTQAIFYGTYEEWVAAGRGRQGAKPVNTFFFGRQQVRTRNYVVLTEEHEELDLLALLDARTLGRGSELPQATAARHVDHWVDAQTAGVPERAWKVFSFPDQYAQGILINLPGKGLVAYSDVCTHLSCSVPYQEKSRQLYCPCHDGLFDAATGNVLAGPPTRPLPLIEITEHEGVIYAVKVVPR